MKDHNMSIAVLKKRAWNDNVRQKVGTLCLEYFVDEKDWHHCIVYV